MSRSTRSHPLVDSVAARRRPFTIQIEQPDSSSAASHSHPAADDIRFASTSSPLSLPLNSSDAAFAALPRRRIRPIQQEATPTRARNSSAPVSLTDAASASAAAAASCLLLPSVSFLSPATFDESPPVRSPLSADILHMLNSNAEPDSDSINNSAADHNRARQRQRQHSSLVVSVSAADVISSDEALARDLQREEESLAAIRSQRNSSRQTIPAFQTHYTNLSAQIRQIQHQPTTSVSASASAPSSLAHSSAVSRPRNASSFPSFSPSDGFMLIPDSFDDAASAADEQFARQLQAEEQRAAESSFMHSIMRAQQEFAHNPHQFQQSRRAVRRGNVHHFDQRQRQPFLSSHTGLHPPSLSFPLSAHPNSPDVDSMSYDQLLALGERIGQVKSKGLNKQFINRLPTWKFVKPKKQKLIADNKLPRKRKSSELSKNEQKEKNQHKKENSKNAAASLIEPIQFHLTDSESEDCLDLTMPLRERLKRRMNGAETTEENSPNSNKNSKHIEIDVASEPESGSLSVSASDSDSADEGECCSICLCPFESGDLLKRLPCIHAFHSSELDTWLADNSNCPLCKFDLAADQTAG